MSADWLSAETLTAVPPAVDVAENPQINIFYKHGGFYHGKNKTII